MFIHLATLASFLLFSTVSAALLIWLVPQRVDTVPAETASLTQLPQPTIKNESVLDRFNNWFERLVHSSGAPLSPHQTMLLIVLPAVTVAAIVFLIIDDFLVSAVVAMLVWTIGVTIVMLLGKRRLAMFEAQLPDAMSLLSKAVRAGESFDQAVQLIGESSPDPLAMEFRRCGGQLEMGLPVATAMRSLSKRVGSFDVQVFASTIAIHRQAGGNLSETLDRLAAVIRERTNYRRQMRSVTGAGRISAVVISMMAPIIFLYLFFFQPQYGQRLWDDPVGKMMIVVAFASQFVGVLWVKYILKSNY